LIPWAQLARAAIPGGAELLLSRRGNEFSIRLAGHGELMNSNSHTSEDALAEIACAALAGRANPVVLVGGLGMGFTLAAALRNLGPEATVRVAEIVPEVVEWNHGPLGEAAGRPLMDPRVEVSVGDVAEVIGKARGEFDAILLDVDNGPEGLTTGANDHLYSPAGLAAAARALRPMGLLAVWSAHPSPAFETRLRTAGFQVRAETVRARAGKGARHTIWVAR
jgi:spermidine synthase